MDNLKKKIINKSKELGITDIKFTGSEVDPSTIERLKLWIDKGYVANMQYITHKIDKRSNLNLILEGVQSVIVCSLYYFPGDHPVVENQNIAKISRYAQGTDYHIVFKNKLVELDNYLHQLMPDVQTKIYVDTGPILEKYFAQKAGIGWQGKNSLIISPDYGSYFFLGVILSNHKFEEDKPINDFCGTCMRCINACPTGALVEPRVLDSNKCIAYWTVEAKPEENFPELVAKNNPGWIFGCDICQEVCPYNRKNKELTTIKEFIKPENFYFNLDEIETFSVETFNKRFKNNPIKRRKFKGFLVNAETLKNRH